MSASYEQEKKKPFSDQYQHQNPAPPPYHQQQAQGSRQQNQQTFQQTPQGQQPQQQQQHAPIPQLAPLPPPGIYCLPQCIAQVPTSIVLRDQLFSFGGDAEIFDVDGRLMFNVRGAAFSMSRRKEVFDNTGTLLFTVRAEVFSVPPAFYCEAPGSNGRFMDIAGKWSMFSPKSEVSFVNNANGEQIKIHLKDNYLNTHAEIKLDNGHVIATIDRDFWTMRSFFGQSQYVLTVAPGMDIALCVAMCLAMDERMKQRQ